MKYALPTLPSTPGLASKRRSLAPAALAAVATLAALAVARRWGVARVAVQGASMEPALLEGDHLVVVRGLRPRPGDVVAVRDPRSEGRVMVKRVRAAGPAGLDVRGDNPEASTDSRTFGPVPRRLVTGRVVWRYAPADRAGRIARTPVASRFT